MTSTYRPSAAPKQTVIEEGSSFKGTLSSSCPVQVLGRMEGDLETPLLTVSQSGAVHGRVKVGAVRSEGELSGEFDADSIELAGTVRDNTVLRARSLEVKLATSRGKLQVIFGECELSIGEEPTEHDRLDEPAAKAEVALVPLPSPAPALPTSESSASMEEAHAASAAVEVSSPTPEGPAVASPTDLEADEGDDDEDSEAEAEPSEAMSAEQPSETPKRQRRRRQADVEVGRNSWSQPPSQPPPAS